MIVIVGLGNMGAAIAERLLRTGHQVAAVDLSEDVRRAWTERTGAAAIGSLDDVEWTTADRLLIVVRLTGQADAVLRQVADLAPGRTLPTYLMTTLDLDFARRLAGHAYGDLRILEAPISGGDAVALAGGLTVMLGGPADQEDLAFLCETLADHVEHFPEHGQPTLAKLLNNVGAYYNTATMVELLLLAQRYGLDPARLRRVLHHSSGGAWVTSRFERLIDDLLVKDAALLTEEVGALPIVSLADSDDFGARFATARDLLLEALDDAATAVPPGTAAAPVAHRHEVRLSYGDCDPAGIVYYAAWLPMMERVLTEWFFESGHPIGMMEETLGATPVTRSATCDYLAPARVHDVIDVAMTVERIGRSSYGLGFTMTRVDDGRVVAVASINCVTLSEGRPRHLPAALRSLLESARVPAR